MEKVKENTLVRSPLALRWLVLGALSCALAALALLAAGDILPEPLTQAADPTRFIAENAHKHLVNLTSIGPRVAGSYENEVLAVGVLVGALREIAAGAAPHHILEIDVHTASGAFSLSFLDGMNNVYRDVQSVVARLSARGGRPPPASRRNALLINCHFDTVPDSPGASDDGAGCAVGLETLRALAAAPAPHPHDVILLLNGAEENIMQASHAFITTHKWAPSVRAFINVEACGAGGREVLFQAGPHDPWIMEVYASSVPHPFASSLAQEIFESGLIPADTDFRVFRDFGNLSGVDLAWSANGYVYHTRLDTADRVPPATLQRTGDNVLALVTGIVKSGRLSGAVERAGGQPVFFDSLGVGLVLLRAHAALAVAAAAIAAALLRVKLHAGAARDELYMKPWEWVRLVVTAAALGVVGALCGAGWAAASGAAVHVAAPLAFYSSPWLLAPLYTLPAIAVSWLATLRLTRNVAPTLRGWARARLAGDALSVWWALALLLCTLAALRSGFIPALWTIGLSASGIVAYLLRLRGGAALLCGSAGAWLPALQTGYVALDALAMLVPIMGRAGPLPHDIVMGALSSALALAACSWLLPLLVVARRPRRLAAALLLLQAAAAAAVLLTPLGDPYSPTRPQRLMVFHTRREDHVTGEQQDLYWTPDLDANSPHSLDPYVSAFRAAVPTSAEECARWVYCGAPFYLPALSVVPRGHSAPAPEPPRTRLDVQLRLEGRPPVLAMNLTGPSHVVVIVSPAEGVRVSRYSASGAGGGAPRPARRWGERETYFFALHDARAPQPWRLAFHLQLEAGAPPPTAAWVAVSAAGHSQAGPRKESGALRALLAALPPHAAPAATGWGVHLHLYTL
ncbi:endoplasmic reticulum metallopeptidase 1-like isoform X2 [Leguminivora glycinivorella]|nr:endoplasmic reticulum metallopeptidase 1-like isoform X2 [Leguminivora glycinivorella]XP_047996669.1 endoplasmic reticulum metallopeptidase 1-like isoform X2 [Leguminivora glycinivorella]